MTTLAQLVAEREIRILKARYCRFVDTKQWGALASLFTDDAMIFFPEAQDAPAPAAEAMKFIASLMAAPLVSIHHVHAPEIEFTAPDSATGIWAMEDRIYVPEGTNSALGMSAVRGFGHYHERYALLSDGWKIKDLRLSRLRIERAMPILAVP